MEHLRMLIVEDGEKHLQDARRESLNYQDIEFVYASTFDQALEAIYHVDWAREGRQNGLDAAVLDVFFPYGSSCKDFVVDAQEPTWRAGLDVGKELDQSGCMFVFNTSGNHHGRKYAEFQKEADAVWGRSRSGFTVAKLIEAYPKGSEDELETKQWSAAINYAILLAEGCMLDDDEVRERIGKIIDFASYGDYGQLTGIMAKVLDPRNSLEDLTRMERTKPPYPWSINALQQAWKEDFIGKTGEWDWDFDRDCFVSLRSPTKEHDEKRFRVVEAKYKRQFEDAVDFIRTTIGKYRIQSK